MTTISLSMIVKNEERFLAQCLQSVQGAVDEIVVVDTGSTDNTVQIARAFGARVAHFPWNDHFAEARNHALSLCTGDWVLSLDADERLLDRHRSQERPQEGMLRRVVNTLPPEVQGVFLTCLSGTPGPVDESPVLRLFRRLPHIAFEGRLHEEVGMTIQRVGGILAHSEIAIIHDGYQASIVASKGKWERNLQWLLVEDQERPDSGFTQYNLGHCYLVMGHAAMQEAEALSLQGHLLAARLLMEHAQGLLTQAQPYFAKSIGLSNPTNLYWTRLLNEARMCGLQLSGAGSDPRMPLDPVIHFRLHPDPLQRVA